MAEEDPFSFMEDVKKTLAQNDEVVDNSDIVNSKKKSIALNKSEGDFSVDKSDDITMDDILNTLQDDPNSGSIRTQVEALKKGAKTVAAPMEEYKRKEIDRQIHYEDAKKTMSSKWVPQMVHLKHKESIEFGYDAPQTLARSTALLVEKFEPTTNLEAELLMAAEEAGLTDEAIRKSDAFGSAPLEQHERQRQVAKLKAMLFREQQRAKRLSKIKSKTYHRIKNRSEDRQKESLLERLEVENPELALQLREEAERKRAVIRAQKRANARAKWAQAASRFGGSEMRKVVSEQAQLAHDERKALERMAKVKPGGNYVAGETGGSDESDYDSDVVNDSSDEEETKLDVVSRARQAVLDELEAMDADTSAVPKGIMSLPFMQRSADAQRSAARAAAEQMLKQLEEREKRGETADSDSDDSDMELVGLDSDEEELVKRQRAQQAADSLTKGVAASDPFATAFTDADMDAAEAEALAALGLATGTKANKGANSVKVAAAIDVTKKVQGEKIAQPAAAAADGAKKQKMVSKKDGKTTFAVVSTPAAAEESESEAEVTTEDNPWMNVAANAKAQAEKKAQKAAAPAASKAAKAVEDSDDERVAADEDSDSEDEGVARVRSRLDGAEDVLGGDIEEALLRGFNRQEGDEALIRQAFTGGDDLEDEWKESLAREEEEALDKANKGKGSMPGWGAGWAGGIKTEKQLLREKREREEKKRQAEERRTKARPLVVLSQKLDRKAAKYQVAEAPKAFGSKEAYEATLSRPLGPEWNTAATHKRVTAPQINVRVGAVVAPLQHAKHLPKAQQDSLIQAWDSRKRKTYTKARL